VNNSTMKKNNRKKRGSLSKDQKMVSDKAIKSKYTIWLKDIILGILNITFIMALVFLMRKLPSKANEIRSLRNSSLLSQSEADADIQEFDIEQNQESIEKIKRLFPKEKDLLNFVSDIENLKQEGSVISFNFASKDPVTDKTKNTGLPILIEMEGSWEQIGKDIKKVQELDYIFRPVSFYSEESPNDGLISVQYGGFLYVDESFK